MHTIRVIVAVILLGAAFICLMIGISEVKYNLPESITLFLVTVLLCLTSVALILH